MNIPEKVINRLSLYHFILDEYGEEEKFISSTRIAELLKIDNSQVRKDIKYLNNSGKCRVGYDVQKLKKSIEEKLGFEKTKEAFIIGAGNLGSALAKYDNFSCYGLEILAMFDNDLKKIGKKINGKEIYNLTELSKKVKEKGVNIAILTVPKEAAQEVAETLSKSGIKYIWNFTACILKTPKYVKVWNENLIGNFLQFTRNDEV